MTGHPQHVAAAPDGLAGPADDGSRPAAAPARTREWSSDHPVNIRLSVSVPLLGRFYFTVVAGKERRNAARLAEERKKHPLLTAGNMAVFATLGTMVALAILALMRSAIHLAFAAG